MEYGSSSVAANKEGPTLHDALSFMLCAATASTGGASRLWFFIIFLDDIDDNRLKEWWESFVKERST